MRVRARSSRGPGALRRGGPGCASLSRPGRRCDDAAGVTGGRARSRHPGASVSSRGARRQRRNAAARRHTTDTPGAGNASPPRVPAPVVRRRHRSLPFLLALALAVRLANLHAMAGLPMAEYQLHWSEADTSLSYEWSGRILQGDVLGRDTVHQYTDWMQGVAPLETWERWWGGKHVFHQAPLYAYALAAMRLVAGDGFRGIGLCQALLGVANVALVFLLAARLFGGAVPTIAALGAALYGPFELHEMFLLRDTLGITVSLLMLWWLAGCDDADARRWSVAGA